MDAHEGSLLECLVLILDRKSNFKVRGCAREHVCLAVEEVCMGMVVIGGGGCLQTTALRGSWLRERRCRAMQSRRFGAP